MNAGRGARRQQVLDVLRAADGPLSTAEIAARLDVHVNTVRFHLDPLVKAGRVEPVAAQSAEPHPGRPAQRFVAARTMDRTGPRHYRLLADVLVQALSAQPDPGQRAAQAGREWGRALASQRPGLPSGTDPVPAARSVGELVDLLDEWGFAPERGEDYGRTGIALRHCPFLELATGRPEVVCAVHLGLMQGALQARESATTVERLDPLVEPDLCRVHVTTLGAL